MPCNNWKHIATQRDITPYRAHAHKRYSSVNPRAQFSDFFRATNLNQCILNGVMVRVTVTVRVTVMVRFKG